MRAHAVVAIIALAVVESGCGVATPSPTASAAASSGAATSLRPPPSPEVPAASLPSVIDIASTEATAIQATDLSDWVIVHGGSVWVIGLCNGIGRLDPATGANLPCAVIPEEPCGAMDAGFGSVWSATCVVSGVARVDPATSAVTTIPLADTITSSETSVGAGEGAVWVIAGAVQQVLVKIDPITETVVGRYPVEAGARGVRVGFGSVWVTNTIENTLTRINPADGTVRARIALGHAPLFLTIGEGAIWVLNQGEGTVSHVDPATDVVLATIAIGPPFTGDIVVGDGSVWVRTGLAAGDTMLVRIDPKTDRVVARYGPAVGGGGVAVSDGVAWISSEDRATIWRLPIR
jgi:virginiamycin B lyase